MTAKDLHFSFDSDLVQAAQAATSPPAEAESATRPASGLSGVTPLPGIGKTARRAPAAKPNRQWLAVTAIALLNMAFLVLAALWLSGNTYQVSDRHTPGINPVAGLKPALTELQAASANSAGQLAALQSTLQEQAQVLLALQTELSQLRAALAKPEAESAATAIQASAPDWHINLGAFHSADTAQTLLKDIRAKGYQPDVLQEVIGGETTYRVVLKGFASRAAADSEAQRIMQQTSLSGLWVWDGR